MTGRLAWRDACRKLSGFADGDGLVNEERKRDWQSMSIRRRWSGGDTGAMFCCDQRLPRGRAAGALLKQSQKQGASLADQVLLQSMRTRESFSSSRRAKPAGRVAWRPAGTVL